MRTFIHYDEDGEVVAVVQTESLPEGVEHPFYIEDARHGVLEVTGGEEKAGWHTGGDIGRDFKVNVAKRKLVGKSAPKRATGEATKKDVTTTEATETKAPETKAATTRSATKSTTKKPETKSTTKKAGTKSTTKKKTATKKAATKKTATKKGKRPSGSK